MGASNSKDHGQAEAKTTAALKKTPRSVLRRVAHCVVDLKQMWATSEGGRNMERIREDVGKILPKFKSLHAAVEALIFSPKNESDDLERTV